MFREIQKNMFFEKAHTSAGLKESTSIVFGLGNVVTVILWNSMIFSFS